MRVFAALAAAVIVFAPVADAAAGAGPGSRLSTVPRSTMLRIFSLSTLAAGTAAVHCALLYTDRRFAATAFYQASLNVFTIVGALSLWKFLGVYGFAIGYARARGCSSRIV